MLELILKIGIAHLLGDFVFQSNKMVSDISNRKFKSIYLYLHILIHFVLILLFTSFEAKYIFPAIVLSMSHLVIDSLTKIGLTNKTSSVYNFIIDQILHICAIAVFINHFEPFTIEFREIFNNEIYLFIMAIILITSVSSIVIKKTMDTFNYSIPNNGLRNAGKYIGILERLFIFAFVSMSFWEGIGFLLAAKSIFRFGDLKEKKEIKLTEYILIGTLLSFGIAIAIGLIYNYFKAIITL